MPGTAGRQVTFAFTSTNPTECCFVPGSDSARPRDEHGGKTGNPPSGSSQSSERKLPLQYKVQPHFQKCPQDTEVGQGGHANSEGARPSSRDSGSRWRHRRRTDEEKDRMLRQCSANGEGWSSTTETLVTAAWRPQHSWLLLNVPYIYSCYIWCDCSCFHSSSSIQSTLDSSVTAL